MDNIQNKSVLVLISTYNGEKYLKEQLLSIFSQQEVNVHLLIRDDGSFDMTLKILNEFALEYSNITVLYEENVGCAMSYNRLMSYSLNSLPQYNYYAFCDQDDIWDDDKLICAINYLEEKNENPLRLYTSSYRVVDNQMKFKYIQSFNYKHTLGEALMMLNTLGCTMVFTKSLMEQAVKIGKVEEYNFLTSPNHDGWLYLTAMVLNSYIYYDNESHINYRQHENNVVGATASSPVSRIKRILKSKGSKSLWASALLRTFNQIDKRNENILSLNANYKDSIKKKWKLVCSSEMKTNSTLINVVYRILVIFNWY